MSDDCKFKTSKYIGPYGKLLRANLQIGNKICLDIGNKRYMLEQCWNVEKYIPKMRKKYLRRQFQLFCTTGSVALWSKTKIEDHNATVLLLRPKSKVCLFPLSDQPSKVAATQQISLP
jgi:hypothetical protein